MAELPKFGSREASVGKNVQGAPVAQQARKAACPACGTPLPGGSMYCPVCGAFADSSPEGLAAFSTGPQFALLKAQATSIEDLRHEVSRIRMLLQYHIVLMTLGGAAMLLTVLWIKDHM